MQPIRIVVVDDVADLRAVVRKNLDMDGRFEVVGEAADAAGAVEVLQSASPDMVLLDIAMPGKTGLQAIPELRAAAPDSKIVVFTVKGESVRQEALDAGADAYVPKYEAFDDVIAQLVRLMSDDSG